MYHRNGNVYPNLVRTLESVKKSLGLVDQLRETIREGLLANHDGEVLAHINKRTLGAIWYGSLDNARSWDDPEVERFLRDHSERVGKLKFWHP